MLFKILNCFTNVSIFTTTYAFIHFIKGDTHMTSTLREGVCVYVCVCDVGDGGGKAYSLDVQSLFLLLKKIEFAP